MTRNMLRFMLALTILCAVGCDGVDGCIYRLCRVGSGVAASLAIGNRINRTPRIDMDEDSISMNPFPDAIILDSLDP